MSLTGLAFVLAFAASMALAVFRHPIFGLYAYVGLFYLHPPSRWWGQMLPDLRWALFAAIVTLVVTLRLPADKSRPSWMSTTPAKLLLLFTAWLLVQLAWALDREQHIELTVLYAKYVLLFYLIYRLIDSEEKVRDFLLVHITGAFYFGYLAYTMEVSGRLEGVGGPGVNEGNALAMQMATAVAVAAMLMLGEKGWRRWLCFAALPFVLNAIILAGSRGAFLAVLVCGLALWRFKPDAYRRWFYLYGALGVVLFGILAHEAFWERVQTIGVAVESREEMDTSALSRLELIDAQWRMFLERPMGSGHRGTEVLSTYYLDEKFLASSADGTKGARSSHNSFMSALVEQGVPGAILFVAFWVWAYGTAAKVRRLTVTRQDTRMTNLNAAIVGALTVVLVAGMFVDYLKAEVQVWLIALLASLSSLAQRDSAAPGTPDHGEVQSSGNPAAARRSRRAGKGKPSS